MRTSRTLGSRRIVAAFSCAVCLAQAVLAAQSAADQASMMDSLSELPAGLGILPDLVMPPNNPETPAKVELGRTLFFDKRLSGDKTLSCGICHDPAKGFSDGRARAVGFHGQALARRTPSIVNAAYNKYQFWDGRAASLEQQALVPLTSAAEMHMLDEQELLNRLEADPLLCRRFQEVFGEGPSITNTAKALAAYERTIIARNSRFDRYAAGEKNALTANEKHGLVLFVGKARCARCHNGPNFTDNQFHNIGTTDSDVGRFAVTKLDQDRGAFKTPSLRNIAERPPYLHDGSLPTLSAVVDYYDRGGDANPNKSPLIMKIGLSPPEREDIVAFLKSLSAPVPK
jgi:cytochrome c peroxidase